MNPPTGHRIIARLIMAGAAALSACQSNASTPQGSVQLKAVQVTSALRNPWSLAFLPDGRMLITERIGNLRIVDRQGNVSDRISGTPVFAVAGQGGLLDVKLSPHFATNPQIFFSYSEPAEGGKARTAVARADFSETALTNVAVIFRQQPAMDSNIHFGSRLVFNAQGDLFVTLGDRGSQDFAQHTKSFLGKVVRIRPDGSVPADNPFIGNSAFEAPLFSYGHRNPQGATLHPESGDLWIHEHGPQGGDEVNRIVAGKNYGWPRITYGVNYGSGTTIGEGTTAADVEPPRYYWVPTSIAPSGMVFYTGDKVPELTGSLLVGALAGRALIRLDVTGEDIGNEQRLLTELGERIRDVRQSPDGYPYLLTDSGKLIRIESP